GGGLGANVSRARPPPFPPTAGPGGPKGGAPGIAGGLGQPPPPCPFPRLDRPRLSMAACGVPRLLPLADSRQMAFSDQAVIVETGFSLPAGCAARLFCFAFAGAFLTRHAAQCVVGP